MSIVQDRATISGDELLQAILSAPLERRRDAVRILRGDAAEPTHAGPEPYMTLRELAKRLGISTATLWRWKIPGHELGGRPRFRLSEVEAYLQSDDFKRRAAALRAIRKERTTKETAVALQPELASPGRRKGRSSSAANSR